MCLMIYSMKFGVGLRRAMRASRRMQTLSCCLVIGWLKLSIERELRYDFLITISIQLLVI